MNTLSVPLSSHSYIISHYVLMMCCLWTRFVPFTFGPHIQPRLNQRNNRFVHFHYIQCTMYIEFYKHRASNGQLSVKLYDKRDVCNCHREFLFLHSNIPSYPTNRFCMSQLTWYTPCSCVQEFNTLFLGASVSHNFTINKHISFHQLTKQRIVHKAHSPWLWDIRVDKISLRRDLSFKWVYSVEK